MPSICMSSGHGKYIRGASGYLDEVNCARAVVDETARLLRANGISVETYHDDLSHSQNENLNRIVNWHNSKSRTLDVSVHFNAYQTTSAEMGVECLYLTQKELAKKVSDAIAGVTGLPNRGPKYRDNLFFLNSTAMPSVLAEVVFVDSSAGCRRCILRMTSLRSAARSAAALSGEDIEVEPPTEEAAESRRRSFRKKSRGDRPSASATRARTLSTCRLFSACSRRTATLARSPTLRCAVIRRPTVRA